MKTNFSTAVLCVLSLISMLSLNSFGDDGTISQKLELQIQRARLADALGDAHPSIRVLDAQLAAIDGLEEPSSVTNTIVKMNSDKVKLETRRAALASQVGEGHPAIQEIDKRIARTDEMTKKLRDQLPKEKLLLEIERAKLVELLGEGHPSIRELDDQIAALADLEKQGAANAVRDETSQKLKLQIQKAKLAEVLGEAHPSIKKIDDQLAVIEALDKQSGNDDGDHTAIAELTTDELRQTVAKLLKRVEKLEDEMASLKELKRRTESLMR